METFTTPETPETGAIYPTPPTLAARLADLAEQAPAAPVLEPAPSETSETFPHSATYSPEDNKIRIYPAFRLPPAEYDAIKAAGYKWAPKQKLFVCPRWTPQAEDAALDLCGDIGDEEQPAAERAAERAERFDGYRERRLDEAQQAASRFDSTGWRIAHARRVSNRRREQARNRGVSRWECAEYWRHRVGGVLRNSDHRDRADVRHRRIQGLESDRRKSLADYAERQAEWDHFAKILQNWATSDKTEEEFSAMFHFFLGRRSGGSSDYPRPAGSKKQPSSLYSLTDPDQAPENKIDGLTALCLWFQRHPLRPEETKCRWLDHYNLRIDFERALLAEQGGTAAQNLADTLAPGAIVGHSGKYIVQRVTKTKAGDLSKIYLLDSERGSVHAFSAERFKWADEVKPATDESRAKLAAFCSKLKANKPKTVPLLNPTKEEAEKILALDERSKRWGYVVHEMTAEQFARIPAQCKRTEEIDLGGLRSDLPSVCRVRFIGSGFNPGMVVLTDKNQTPLPCDLSADLTAARRVARIIWSHHYSQSDIIREASEKTGQAFAEYGEGCRAAKVALIEYGRKTWPAAFGVTEETAETVADAEESATVEESETLETEEANA
jgi:hypothetical protein